MRHYVNNQNSTNSLHCVFLDETWIFAQGMV
ncbi:unnamed protein product [Acanthoscelides obtectus]|uniref:Uncharacterized protein n=1 Tax=Acanthoscelides obtectus TaxID=200917 RepID=A0A9P0JN64_ACAOB|nr:unnamed protein product [Acanthoscelides obtectus]CAK1639907.1 hypothetical protein AOBTE_LOCUS11441 [Acanthoscelides obtectus]